jgi:hypothetical protein
MAEDGGEVAELARRHRPGQRGDVDLVDQVAEVGRLGEQFDVEEGRDRLRDDARERLAAMDAARGVDVEHWHVEGRPPGPTREPAAGPPRHSESAPADGEVAAVDGLEQGVEVGRGPGLNGRRDDDQRQARPVDAPFQRPRPSLPADRLDHGLGRPFSLSQQADESLRDSPGRLRRPLREHHHPRPGPSQRLATQGERDRVVEVVEFGMTLHQ